MRGLALTKVSCRVVLMMALPSVGAVAPAAVRPPWLAAPVGRERERENIIYGVL